MTKAPMMVPPTLPRPPHQGSPAENDRRDGIQLERLAGGRMGRAQLCGDDEPHHRGTDPGDDVDREFDLRDPDPREFRRSFVAAHRIDAPAERRPLGRQHTRSRKRPASARLALVSRAPYLNPPREILCCRDQAYQSGSETWRPPKSAGPCLARRTAFRGWR